MPTIDLGVDFEDVKNEDQFEPLPNATYDFTVASCEPKTALSGRPMIKWTFDIIYEGRARKLFHNTVLPWTKDGELDVSGIGMLVAVCKALGRPWSGGQITTEDYLGLAGACEVYQKPKQVKDVTGQYVDDPEGGVVNDIKKFVT